MSDGSGKPCPRCGSPMADLRSMQKRLCASCGHEEDWTLAHGQAPLIGPSRAKNKAPR